MFSTFQGTRGEPEWTQHQNLKDRQRRWICFKWTSKFFHNPWHTKVIHCTIYTSTEWCCRKKEQNHYGDGAQHDGNQAFVKWILGWSSHNCCIYHEPMSNKECEEQSSLRNMDMYESQCFSFKIFWLCCICLCSRWAKKEAIQEGK